MDTLKNRNVFPHSSGGWRSESRVPAWSGSAKISPLACRYDYVSLCPHLCQRGGERNPSSPSFNATVLSDQSTILMISGIVLPSRDPVFKYSHFGGQNFNILILGRRISVQKNSLTLFLFNIILEPLFSALNERRMNAKEWNKKTKCWIFTNDMIVYIEILKNVQLNYQN